MTRESKILLARARALLDSPDPAAVGSSARLAAFLARQAVEDLIDNRCAALGGVKRIDAKMKAKLAIIASLDRSEDGEALIAAWHHLTGFCHQHAYELSPTVAEVREQCLAVERCCLAECSGVDGS